VVVAVVDVLVVVVGGRVVVVVDAVVLLVVVVGGRVVDVVVVVVDVVEPVVVVRSLVVLVVVVFVVVVEKVVVGTVAAKPPIWMIVSFAPVTASDVLTKTSFPVTSSKTTPTGGATKPEAKSASMGRAVPSVGRCVVRSIGSPVPGSIVSRCSSPKL
jgi:hypothetical protein